MSAARELRRNEWVTIAQAATRLATNHWRIRKWIEREKVPRKGNTYLFRVIEEIDDRIRHSDTEPAS